jgi:hypothetical protein
MIFLDKLFSRDDPFERRRKMQLFFGVLVAGIIFSLITAVVIVLLQRHG